MDKPLPKVKKRTPRRIQTAVSDHAAEKAREIYKKYGPTIDYPVLLRILEDRKSIRYPVKIQFESDRIEPGMFARTEAVSDEPADGYVITVHGRFRDRPEVLPPLVLYQAVIANYGELATAVDAEIFGAGVLGMERDEYYSLICELVDSIDEYSMEK